MLNLKSASKGLNHHHYDPYTLSSIEFGDLLPIKSIEVVPSDDFTKIKADGLIRLAPMVFPPFGRCYLNSAAFFVPEHQLIDYSLAFHSRQEYYKGHKVVLPYFTAWDFNEVFFATRNSTKKLITVYSSNTDTPLSPAPSPDLFDFIHYDYVAATGVKTYYYCKLTRLGQKYFKILKSLGYDFGTPGNSTVVADVKAACDEKLNALPLLAYLKCYVDMFLPGTLYDTDIIVSTLHSIQHGESIITLNTDYDSSTGHISTALITKLLYAIALPHRRTNFLKAWNKPNAAFDSSSLPLNYDPSNSSMDIVTNDRNSPYDRLISNADFSGMVPDNGYYTGRVNRLVIAFDKFVRRFNLSGSKAVQKIYAEFGIKTDDFNSYYVHKLYEGSSRIQTSPIFSNSDTFDGTDGKSLGAYAGMGAAGLNINFNYKASTFGYIIVLSWLQFDPIYFRGMDASTLRFDPFDFYTPEFDGAAMRAIPHCELGPDKDLNLANTSSGFITDKSVFGFQNLYDDYRSLRDTVSGEFINGYTRDYFFGRDFSILRSKYGFLLPQSKAVQCYAEGNNPDMSDPFQMDSSNGDRFMLYFEWDIDALRPVLNDEDAWDLTGKGDIKFHELGDMMS